MAPRTTNRARLINQKPRSVGGVLCVICFLIVIGFVVWAMMTSERTVDLPNDPLVQSE